MIEKYLNNRKRTSKREQNTRTKYDQSFIVQACNYIFLRPTTCCQANEHFYSKSGSQIYGMVAYIRLLFTGCE